jgi:hypothetical protein
LDRASPSLLGKAEFRKTLWKTSQYQGDLAEGIDSVNKYWAIMDDINTGLNTSLVLKQVTPIVS